MKQGCWLRGLTILGMVLATLFVIGAVAWTVANIRYGQMLQTELAALKAEGYPLTVSEVVPKPIPAAQNAATIYMELFQVSFDPAQTSGSGPGGPNTGLRRFELPVGFKVDLPSALAARPIIESAECRRAVARLREASLRPQCVFPVRWEDGFAALFPHLAQFRQAARLVAVRAILDGRDGKLAVALDWLAVGYRLADHTAQEPSLIAQLVAYAVRAIADQAAQVIIANADVPGAVGRGLYDQLAKVDVERPFVAGMRMEVAQGITAIESIRRGGESLRQLVGDEENPLALILYSLLSSTIGRPVLKLEEANYARQIRQSLKLSFQAYRESAHTPNVPIKHGLGNILAGILLPVYSRAGMKRDESLAQVRLLQTVLALKAHRKERGSYPAGLSELAWRPPTEDPFSGKMFVYRRQGTGFVLYSIGPNLQDDGGQEPSKPGKIEQEGDMVWQCGR